MAVYELVNAQGVVVNRIEWDGITPYTPEEGFTLREETPPAPEPEPEA